MNITFIGNCQTVSLCFYFQELLGFKKNNICWVLYGNEFKQHLNHWSDKCKNKIIDYHESIQQIRVSDVIIYQEINVDKSLFSNTEKLNELKRNSCKLIKIPSIYLNYRDYDNSLKKLRDIENINNVDIKVSNILETFKNFKLMFSNYHPKTFLFLKIMKEICLMLEIPFFTKEQSNNFLKNENFMGLP
jgi:hypothetical protein